jgi:hypothetical protein
MSEKLGQEKVNAIVEAIGHVVIAGKKISADKKIDLEDLPAAMDLLMKAPAIVAAFKDIGEAFNEVKDTDVAEVVALIKLIDEKIKLIEKA